MARINPELPVEIGAGGFERPSLADPDQRPQISPLGQAVIAGMMVRRVVPGIVQRGTDGWKSVTRRLQETVPIVKRGSERAGVKLVEDVQQVKAKTVRGALSVSESVSRLSQKARDNPNSVDYLFSAAYIGIGFMVPAHELLRIPAIAAEIMLRLGERTAYHRRNGTPPDEKSREEDLSNLWQQPSNEELSATLKTFKS